MKNFIFTCKKMVFRAFILMYLNNVNFFMEKTMFIKLLVLMSFFSFLGCSRPEDPGNKETPQVPRKDIELTKAQQELVHNGNLFALNLMKKVHAEKEGKGWIMSPLSVQYALGMVLNGAKGETAAQISRTLGYGDSGTDEVNMFCKTLTDGIGEVDPSTAINIANVLVYNTHNDGANGIRLEEPFVKALSDYYYAGIETFDFTTENQAALARINAWSSEKTKGMIPKILEEVGPDHLAYFLNAVYFNGMWANKFNKNYTSSKPFTKADGTKVDVDMMTQKEDFGYYEDESGVKILSMPYGNGAFKMTVVLPESAKGLDNLVASLGEDFLERMKYLRTVEVDVKFPKFETASDVPLNDALKALGMELPFKEGADFTGMSLYADHISKVFQKARIKVDEEGSEAAAVTVVGMLEATAIPNPKYYFFHADRPFLYMISEKSTGAILFIGTFTGK